MKKLLPVVGAVLPALSFVAQADDAKQPNVVIFYGDDVGYGDVGVYGSKMIPTPNIDKLASEGIVFTDGHCSAATSTPSRYSMLTGIHGFRHNVRVLAPNAPMAVPLDRMTLPKLFKKAGYSTAVIGKWHLGLGDGKNRVDWNNQVKPGPREVGFDYSFLLPYTNDRVPCVYLENYKVVGLDPKDPLYVGRRPAGAKSTVYPDGRKNREAMTYFKSSVGHNNSVINGIGRIGYMWGGKSALWNDETMSDTFLEQAKKYIGKQKKDKPFFLYFASQEIHVPRVPHPRFKGKTKLGPRGDAMVEFDWATGQVMKMLEEKGLRDNTIVIFSSDNGPVYDDGYYDGCTVPTSSRDVDRGHDASGPYRGGKYQIAEGGTRVPFIVSWPNHIKPGKSSALVSQIDFMASFADFLKVKLPENAAIDSQNSLKALLGKDCKGNSFIVEEAGQIALRLGKWKYVPGRVRRGWRKRGGPKMTKGRLYDLDTDKTEMKNIIDKHPKKAKEMGDILEKIRTSKGIRTLPDSKKTSKTSEVYDI